MTEQPSCPIERQLCDEGLAYYCTYSDQVHPLKNAYIHRKKSLTTWKNKLA